MSLGGPFNELVSALNEKDDDGKVMVTGGVKKNDAHDTLTLGLLVCIDCCYFRHGVTQTNVLFCLV